MISKSPFQPKLFIYFSVIIHECYSQITRFCVAYLVNETHLKGRKTWLSATFTSLPPHLRFALRGGAVLIKFQQII